MPADASIWSIGSQYGMLGIVLVFVGVCIWKGGRWAGDNILLPIANAHIAFLRESTSAMKQLQGDMSLVTTAETELRKLLDGHVVDAKDICGHHSTVHTNGALRIMSKQLVALARQAGVDLQDLHDELEAVLQHQHQH